MSQESFNLSPERDFIDASELPSVVELYMADVRRRAQMGRLKQSTAAGYEYLLGLLLEWWAGAGPGLGYELDPDAWLGYAAWLESRQSSQSGAPLALSVRKKALIMCSQLLRWCHKKRILSRDYSPHLPTISGSDPPRTLPDKVAQRSLMAAAGESPRPVRDRAIVAVCLGTGVRRAEAAGLDVEDVVFHADGGGVLNVRHAKLGKPRKAIFDQHCGAYLLALIEELGRDAGPLFTQWKDKRLAPEGIWRAVKRALQAAGIDERGRGPHELRRIFVTEYARANPGLMGDKRLGLQVGHSDRSMTAGYVYVTLDDVQEGFRSPLAGLEE